MTFARITGTGSYLPERILTNAELEAMVATSDEWIRDRTGICERHIAAPGEATCDLAEHATLRALEASGRTAADVDLIIVATTTPDRVFPSTACLLQKRLGIHGCAAFDIQAVCTGFVYALGVAEKFVRTGAARCARCWATTSEVRATTRLPCGPMSATSCSIRAGRGSPGASTTPARAASRRTISTAAT